MRALKILAKIVVGLAVILTAAWHYYFPKYHHRYKLIVAVESDGKVQTGVGIVDVWAQWQDPARGLAGGNSVSFSIKGRPAIINLGEKGVLLALVEPGVISDMNAYIPRPQSGVNLAFCGYYGKIWDYDLKTSEWLLQARLKSIKNENGRRELSSDCYPAFVWLSDPKSRNTAIPLAPGQFGSIPGGTVSLRSVMVEITNEPFSNEAFELLPWLTELAAYKKQHFTVVSIDNFSISAYQILGGT